MCLNLCSLNEKPWNWLFKRKYRMCVGGCVMPHMVFHSRIFFSFFLSPAFNSQYGARLLFLQESPDLITRCPAEPRRFPEFFFKDTVPEIFCGLFGSVNIFAGWGTTNGLWINHGLFSFLCNVILMNLLRARRLQRWQKEGTDIWTVLCSVTVPAGKLCTRTYPHGNGKFPSCTNS